MPYITGTKDTLENRIHALATGQTDIVQYAIEGGNYNFSGAYKDRLNFEFRRRLYAFSGIGIYPTGDYI